jgi:anti-sigma regulatory factor (Ser/Thr protein kinase)
MRTETTEAPEAVTFERDYPGMITQASRVRADLTTTMHGCPAADDVVLLASELATNAILHSQSGHPTRTFTVRVVIYPGEYTRAEVIDQGGAWTKDDHDDDEHGRGLQIVAAIAGEGNWGIDGDDSGRVTWFRLDWDQQ